MTDSGPNGAPPAPAASPSPTTPSAANAVTAPASWLWAGAVFGAAMISFWLVFGTMMPGVTGMVGHDFSLLLPGLFVGRVWFEANGPLVTPWFVPSMCGGVWWFPSAGSGYYSIPQALAMMMSPLAAVQVSFLSFAGIGFAGTFLLVRRCFGVALVVALAAAVIMTFNGFYAYRSVIGHFFHSFMILPLICYLALRGARQVPGESPGQRSAFVLQLLGVAGGWAYVILSGATQLLPHFALAAALVLLVHGVVVGPSGRPWLLMAGGGAFALCLSAAKLSAAMALTAQFQRADYKLPGASDLLESAGLMLRSLFFQAPADATAQLENVQWALERHEWEYGLSPVALILLLVGAVMFVRAANKASIDEFLRNRVRVLTLITALTLAFIPIALNTYGEPWNAFLKSTPILGSMSSMVRWICVYIPVLVVLCALSLNHLFADAPKRQMAAAVLAMVAVVGYNALADKAFYKNQSYSPEPIQSAYRQLEQTGKITPVQGVGVFFDAKTNVIQMPINRNDTFLNGWSQLACYEPQFGYRLEWFPQKTLQPGPATDVREGRYNFKDPSCYVFPEANKCEPGDHFKVGEEQRMEKLLNYKPYPFRFSQSQQIANLVSLVSWIGAGLVLVLALVSALRRRAGAAKGAQ